MNEWINPWPDWSIQVWNVILFFFLRVLKCWTWNIFGHVRQNRLLWMKAGLGSHLWKVIFVSVNNNYGPTTQKYRLVHRKWVNLLFGELRLWHDISEKGWNRYCLHKDFVFRRLEGQQEDIITAISKEKRIDPLGLIHKNCHVLAYVRKPNFGLLSNKPILRPVVRPIVEQKWVEVKWKVDQNSVHFIFRNVQNSVRK